jgi:hypothetical protein
MNIFSKTLIIIFLAFLLSCGDDDSKSATAPAPVGPQYADQDLQGTLFGDSWMNQSATLLTIANGANPGIYIHIFTLRSEPDTNICSRTNGGLTSYFLPNEKYLNIFLETDTEILEEGFYKFEEAGTVGAGAFYFYTSNDSSVTSQIGSTDGSILITKVDTDTDIVEGSLIASDEEFDTNSSVNGNFIADYCRP